MDEPTEPGRVLVVDDDGHTIDAATLALEKEGYVVEGAPNGAVGLERVLTFRPEVVVFDFWMPVADGRDLVLGIREVTRVRVGLVAMSGTPEVEDWCGRVGVSAFVRKPFDAPTLRGAVARAFDDAKSTSSMSMRAVRISDAPTSRRVRLDRAVLVVGGAGAIGHALRLVLREAERPMQVAVVPDVGEAIRALQSISVDAIAVCAGPALSDARLVDLVGESQARGLPIILESAPGSQVDHNHCRISEFPGVEGVARTIQEAVR